MRHPVYLGGEGGAEAAAGGRAGPELGRRDEGLAIRPEGPGPGSGPMAPLSREPLARGGRAAAPTFYVAGFWRRLAGGLVDLAILAPVVFLLTWLAAVVTGIQLPPANHRGLDFWLDMILAREPALIAGIGLALAIAVIYVFLFQATAGRTVGMRVLGMEVIDVFGEPPSIARVAARTAGYLAGAATLGLGFFWIGFDSEKRALHDWLAGTYVVLADPPRRA